VIPLAQLVDELCAASSPPTRCPHVARDAEGCLCRSPGCRDSGRRLVVDHCSLQPWCLDAERFQDCLFYTAGD
jgi:hypothetical protein